MDINKSVTLKNWLSLSQKEKEEFREELNFPNIEGEVQCDVFGVPLKEGMPVYELGIKGIKAYCTVMNYFKLTPALKQQFKTASVPFKTDA